MGDAVSNATGAVSGWGEQPSKVRLVLLDGANWPAKRMSAAGVPRYVCEKCGTWTCDRCGHKRMYANRRYTRGHECAKCLSRKGTWKVVYHGLQKWANHYGHVPLRDWVYEDWQKGLPGRTGK